MLSDREKAELLALQNSVRSWFRDRQHLELRIPGCSDLLAHAVTDWAREAGYLAKIDGDVIRIVKVSRYGGRFTQ